MRGVSRGTALLIALIAVLVGVVSYAIGVGSLLGQRAEASLLDASDFTVNPPGPLALVSPLTVVIALLTLAVLTWFVYNFGRALWFLLFSTAAIVLSQLLKQQVLERPNLFDIDAPNTFPSGHMTVFAVTAGGLIWASSARWRWFSALIGAAVMGIVAWQLLEYGWHRPSDIVGAQALAVLALALAAALRLSAGTVRPRPGPSASVAALMTSVVLLIAGVALVIGGIGLAILAASHTSDELMLAGGQIAMVGLSCLAARAFSVVSA